MRWGENLFLLGHTDGAGPGPLLLVVAGLALVGLTVLVAVVGVMTSRSGGRRKQAGERSLPTDPAQEVISCTVARESLLTPGELLFYRMLEPLVSPRCLVFAKVRLADLFKVDNCSCRCGAEEMLSGKRIDFVLCDPSSSGVVAAIELDENASEGPERTERERFIDDLFASNGLPLLRVPEGAGGDIELLQKGLARHDLLPARAGSVGRRSGSPEVAGV